MKRHTTELTPELSVHHDHAIGDTIRDPLPGCDDDGSRDAEVVVLVIHDGKPCYLVRVGGMTRPLSIRTADATTVPVPVGATT